MGFLNPSAWFFAALGAVLVALYLWERYRRRVDVPSLLLWETIPDAIVRTSRFRPDFLFVLQLLVLTLLIAGLADPYLSGGGEAAGSRYIFILDTSASMQAREGPGTRFDAARAALGRRLGELNATDEAMLITAANHPRVVDSFSSDQAALLAILADLQPVDTGANLDLALAIAHRAAERSDAPTSIEVFTDTPRSDIAPQWRQRVALFGVGETDDNLAIESLQIFQGRFQDYRDVRAHVAVRNFSHREAHGVLTLQLEDQILDRHGFSLAARSARGFPVRDLPGPGILGAHLEVDDALAADNHAYGWIRPTHPIRVLVVSDAPALQAELDIIGQMTPALEFRYRSPSDYRAEENDGSDIVLFYRFVPNTAAEIASLYVYPATGDGSFTVRGEASELKVINWNQDHPVLQALRPELAFPLSRVRLIDLPVWADSLLSSRSEGREILLAFAGERGGRRTAGIAFDLVADNLLGADHVDLLLFFLNLLEWLAPADQSVTITRTGDVEVIADLPSQPGWIVDPRGQMSPIVADGPLTIEMLYAGGYRIGANGTSRRVFANLVDASESDIGRPAQVPFEPPEPIAAGALRPVAGSGFGIWLYALAAGLLLVEWLVARREV